MDVCGVITVFDALFGCMSNMIMIFKDFLPWVLWSLIVIPTLRSQRRKYLLPGALRLRRIGSAITSSIELNHFMICEKGH